MEIKIRTPFLSSQPDSSKRPPDVKRVPFGSGGMNVTYNSASGSMYRNSSREIGMEQPPSQGKLYAPPESTVGYEKIHSSADEVGLTNSKAAGSGSERSDAPSRSRNSELQDDSGANSRRNEGTPGWGMGRNVLEVSKGVASDIRGSLFHMKDLLVDKLAAVPIPAESLDNARHSIESIIREATHTAYGLTKDAMLRIRFRLLEIIPSLSPNETKQIVDDVEREVLDMSEAAARDSPPERMESHVKHSNTGVSASAASAVSPNQPLAPSALSMNMNRIKSWALFRSRL